MIRWRPQARGFSEACTRALPSLRPTLRLVPRTKPGRGGDARVSRLSPWVYRNEASNVDELRSLGSPALLVNVESAEGRELGVAACNLAKGGKSGVVVLARLLAQNVHVVPDALFFAKRLARAMRLREQAGYGTFHRLLNAEGDLVPGVVCDRYGDVVCLQFMSSAMQSLFEGEVVQAVQEVLSPQAIIIRCEDSVDRKLDLATVGPAYLARGEYDGPTAFPDEDGFSFSADLLSDAWRSGRFFAERRQRRLAMDFVRQLDGPPRVLSFFGESLGVACASLGAELTFVEGLGEVTEASIRKLADLNGAAQVRCVRAEEQHGLPSDLGKFDLVSLQPPPLAPTYGRVEEGQRQYIGWLAMAASAVRPGGLLIFASRSRTLTTVKLLRCVNLGLWQVGRSAAITHHWEAELDFPVHLAVPDTNEMQVIVLRMRN